MTTDEFNRLFVQERGVIDRAEREIELARARLKYYKSQCTHRDNNGVSHGEVVIVDPAAKPVKTIVVCKACKKRLRKSDQT